jgi:hypothetical protein
MTRPILAYSMANAGRLNGGLVTALATRLASIMPLAANGTSLKGLP